MNVSGWTSNIFDSMLYSSMEALNNEKRALLHAVPGPRYKAITEQNAFQCSVEIVSCYMWEAWQASEAECEIISWKAATWEKVLTERTGSVWKLSIKFSECCHWISKRLSGGEPDNLCMQNLYELENLFIQFEVCFSGTLWIEWKDYRGPKKWLSCT